MENVKPSAYLLTPVTHSNADRPLLVSEIKEENVKAAFTYNIKVLGETLVNGLLSFKITDIVIEMHKVTVYLCFTDKFGNSSELSFEYNSMFTSDKYKIH